MEFSYPVGLITNVNAKRIRKTIINASDLYQILGGESACLHRETATLDELKEAVREFREKKIQIILSNGGDGTHQQLINTLIDNFRDYSPFIVPLKSGTMNMLAKNLDLNLSPYDTVEWIKRLMEKKEKPVISVRSLLQVDSPELKKPRYGFVFIAGCGFKVLNLYYSYPEGGKRSASKAIISSMMGWLTGNKMSKNIYTYTPSTIMIDDKKFEFPYLITLASSLEKLVMGFSPFALKHVNHDGFFFMIDGEPMTKNYNIFKFFKLNDEEVWKEKRLVSRGKVLKLDVDGGFSIDGELIKLNGGSGLTPVTVTRGPKINFITPIAG
ncbi:MAG: diacylglycerol kinase family protein [bacterium]